MQSQLNSWAKLYKELKTLDNIQLLDRIERGESWVEDKNNHQNPKFNDYLRALTMMQKIYSERSEKEVREAMK